MVIFSPLAVSSMKTNVIDVEFIQVAIADVASSCCSYKC